MFKKLSTSGALVSVALLAACAQPEPTNDVISIFAKDGTIIGYERVSDGVRSDVDGNPLPGFGVGNDRGFGEGTLDDGASQSGDDDDDED